MPGPSHLASFVAVSLVILAIPGPSVVFVVGRALAYGRRTALASVTGNECGALVLVVAVAVGVGALVERSQLAYEVLKLVGAAYLVFLGVRAWRQRDLGAAGETSAAVLSQPSHPVRDGFIVGVANPKVAIFFTAVLPQFVDRRAGHVTVQLLVLGTFYVVLAFVTDSMWGIAASGLRSWFGRSASRVAAIRRVGSLALIGVGVSLALTGRRE